MIWILPFRFELYSIRLCLFRFVTIAKRFRFLSALVVVCKRQILLIKLDNEATLITNVIYDDDDDLCSSGEYYRRQGAIATDSREFAEQRLQIYSEGRGILSIGSEHIPSQFRVPPFFQISLFISPTVPTSDLNLFFWPSLFVDFVPVVVISVFLSQLYYQPLKNLQYMLSYLQRLSIAKICGKLSLSFKFVHRGSTLLMQVVLSVKIGEPESLNQSIQPEWLCLVFSGLCQFFFWPFLFSIFSTSYRYRLFLARDLYRIADHFWSIVTLLSLKFNNSFHRWFTT